MLFFLCTTIARPMRNRHYSFLNLLLVAVIASALPQVSFSQSDELPAVWQRKVQQLVKNIDRSQQALTAQGAEDLNDPFKAKQWQDRIENYRSGLARVPESSDPLLVDARKRLTALESSLSALQDDVPVEQSTKPAETAVSQSTSGSTEGPQLVSGQRVQVRKLKRDLDGVLADIVTTGPSPLQSADVVQKYQGALERYAGALKRFERFKNDPDVQTSAAAYRALVDGLQAEQRRAADQARQLGDVQGRLATLEGTLRSNQSPGELYAPFSLEEASAWVQQLAAAQQAAQSANTEIQSIAPLAYLPDSPATVSQGAPYDSQDLNRLLNFANGIQTDVNSSLDSTQARLKHQFDFQDQHELGYFRQLDPASDKDRMNAYLAEGAEGEILERLDKQMALAESVAAYQMAFGKEPTNNTQSRIAEINQLRRQYLKDRAKVLGGYRLPEPASTDSDRMATAEQILANPEYGFGEHGPVVLTTEDIVSREKEVSRDTIKDVDVSLSGTITLSGTRETWNYRWQEFKFATPLKETDNNEWYVWWITAKKYESGWEKTPIGRWVSGNATKGSLILEENFR